MATYDDLFGLAIDPGAESETVQNRVTVAVSIAAQGYLADVAATPAQKAWATAAVRDRNSLIAEGARIWPLVVAANAGASVASINGASDAAVQSNVDSVVAQVADGLYGGV